MMRRPGRPASESPPAGHVTDETDYFRFANHPRKTSYAPLVALNVAIFVDTIPEIGCGHFGVDTLQNASWCGIGRSV